MAEGVHNPEQEQAPPPGEPIHLPGPSYLPVVTAFGVSLALVGVVLSLIICGVGVLITVVAIALWIRDTRTEMSELPLEH